MSKEFHEIANTYPLLADDDPRFEDLVLLMFKVMPDLLNFRDLVESVKAETSKQRSYENETP